MDHSFCGDCLLVGGRKQYYPRYPVTMSFHFTWDMFIWCSVWFDQWFRIVCVRYWIGVIDHVCGLYAVASHSMFSQECMTFWISWRALWWLFVAAHYTADTPKWAPCQRYLVRDCDLNVTESESIGMSSYPGGPTALATYDVRPSNMSNLASIGSQTL